MERSTDFFRIIAMIANEIQDVSTMIEVIRGIVEQTIFLALNTAIRVYRPYTESSSDFD
jgi:methyl-accepting chemotaxis protein